MAAAIFAFIKKASHHGWALLSAVKQAFSAPLAEKTDLLLMKLRKYHGQPSVEGVEGRAHRGERFLITADAGTDE